LGSNINTEGNELFPTLFNNHLYFASNGHGGLGGLDLFGIDIENGYEARIINLGAPINSNMDDFGIALDSLELTGYISSNRDGSLNKDNIYSFVAQKTFISSYLVKGKVLDQYEKHVLSGAVVYLVQDTGIIDSVSSNENGEFTFLVEARKDYKLTAVKTKYLQGEEVFSTNEVGKEEWQQNIFLKPDYAFGMHGLIFDKSSNERLSKVQVKITDNFTQNIIHNGETDEAGSFTFDLNEVSIDDKLSYQIHIEKEGYLGRSVAYNTIVKKPGVIELQNELDLHLDKIGIGTDIGKIIDVKPIYFNLGKYAIRPDAAKELDKIVKIMNENPTLEIELGSHTDARGNSPGNLRLSDKRAKSSADYIISQGISKSRILGKGYGESNIINRCVDGIKCSEDEHQLNRRTEFKITKF
jgi:outer membrane protein OmpA-like peptidoglycan-associated protein